MAEALGVLRGNDRLAGFGFQRFSRHTRDIAAAPGDLLVFVKALRLLGFRNIGGRRFCQHGQHQLQIAHIIAEIFLFQPLEILILPCVHASPRAGDLVRQNRVFFALLHAALFPLVHQLVSDADGKQPLMYPFLGIALFQICFQRAVDRLLRVDGFLNAFPSDHRQPRLERLGFLGGNGLDDAQKLLRVGNVRQAVFAVRRTHFQLVTIRHQFIALVFQPLFQLVPVFSPGIIVGAVCQDADNVHNGKIPFLPFSVPHHADLLVLKKLNFVFHRFVHSRPPQSAALLSQLSIISFYFADNIVHHQNRDCKTKMRCISGGA